MLLSQTIPPGEKNCEHLMRNSPRKRWTLGSEMGSTEHEAEAGLRGRTEVRTGYEGLKCTENSRMEMCGGRCREEVSIVGTTWEHHPRNAQADAEGKDGTLNRSR